MKKIFSVLLSAVMIIAILTSCENKHEKFTESFIDYFDTVATVTGYSESVYDFNIVADRVETQLKEYHELFDIYNTYSGKNNIKTINDMAGISPVTVKSEIIDLLDYSKEIYSITKGKTDITMGAVLKIWHDYRTSGSNNPAQAILPNSSELFALKEFCGFDKIEINYDESTVFITEKGVSIDVGAIAKGYATEKIAKSLEEDGFFGYALNIGGNIRAIGDKPDGDKWTASVSDPNGNGSLMTVRLKENSFVTSGSYIRFYFVDGVRYHHIIDPETLFPKNEFSSISVMTDNSGYADALSTALFCMSYEDGLDIVRKTPNTEAIWVRSDGEVLFSDGFEDLIIKE